MLAVAPGGDARHRQSAGLALNIGYHATPAARTSRHLRDLYQGRRGPGPASGRSHRP